jgi:hypothetical protein
VLQVVLEGVPCGTVVWVRKAGEPFGVYVLPRRRVLEVNGHTNHVVQPCAGSLQDGPHVGECQTCLASCVGCWLAGLGIYPGYSGGVDGVAHAGGHGDGCRTMSNTRNFN